MNNNSVNQTVPTDPYGDDPTKTPSEMPEGINVGGFLNVSAHNQFMNLTPKVLTEHKNFMNNLNTLPESTTIAETFNKTQTESPKTNSLPDFTNNLANCKSEHIPQVNQNKDNNDDDNNNNKTKMIDITTDNNNSVLAMLENGLLLAEMKSQFNETLTCNEQSTSESQHNSTLTY
jgi:hypothetical protein